MAKAFTLTIEAGATEGGTTVLDMKDTFEGTFDDVNKHTLRIPNGSDKFIAVQGTDLTGETDPMVLALNKIRGIFVKSAVALGIQIDGAAAAVTIHFDHPLPDCPASWRGTGRQLAAND